jgi:Ca2+-binding EF-hand superfamily protein
MKNRTLYMTAALAAIVSLFPLGLRAQDEPKPKPGAKQAAAFAAADKDNDGKLNLAEFTEFSKARLDAEAAKAKFSELDADKDGFLTKQELRAGMRGGKGGGKKAQAEGEKPAEKDSESK